MNKLFQFRLLICFRKAVGYLFVDFFGISVEVPRIDYICGSFTANIFVKESFTSFSIFLIIIGFFTIFIFNKDLIKTKSLHPY
jgi:hypothetical protein